MTLQCILYFLCTDVWGREIWRGRAGGLGSISPTVTGRVGVCQHPDPTNDPETGGQISGTQQISGLLQISDIKISSKCDRLKIYSEFVHTRPIKPSPLNIIRVGQNSNPSYDKKTGKQVLSIYTTEISYLISWRYLLDIFMNVRLIISYKIKQ